MAKANADAVLKRSIEDILFEIEQTLNTKMEEFNDSLFDTKKKPPHVHFNSYNSYKFETPDNTGTGSNYKGMIVYDLAVLFTTAFLPYRMIRSCSRIWGKILRME